MTMLHPGNDSGTTALITDEYDALMSHIVGEPLQSLVALSVWTADGRHGLFTWKYQPASPAGKMKAIDVNPLNRLVSTMSAVRCATGAAEGEGLECA